MDENKTNKILNGISKYGTYVILVICIIGVAVAAILLVPSDSDEKKLVTGSDGKGLTGAKDEPNKKSPSIEASSSNDQSFELVIDAQTGKPIQNGSEKVKKGTPDIKKTDKDTKKSDLLLAPPVNGEIIWKFAMSELIYSKTLDQWTTHSGIDIACKKGDKVRAVADGIVNKVYTDDSYGVTVVIKHSNGDLSIYSSLAKEDLIEEGVKVAKNQTIGKCGNTAIFECESQSHIHFEYHVNGKPVDPTKYIKFTES